MTKLSPDAIELLRDRAILRKIALLSSMFDHPKQREAARAVAVREDKASELIAQLEQHLTVPLTEMDGNRKVPNATAEMLRPEFEALTEAFNSLAQSIGAVRRGQKGSIRLGCYNPALKLFLADTIGAFTRSPENQGYEVQLPTSMTDRRVDGVELLDDLRNGKFDYIVIPRPLDRSGPAIEDLEIVGLYKWNVVVILHEAHRLRDHARVTPADLEDEPLLLSPLGYVSRLEVDSGFALARIRPRVILENGDTLTRVALARNGYGVALAPTDTLDTVPDRPWPVFEAKGAALCGEYDLLWKHGSTTERVPPEIHSALVDAIASGAATFREERGLDAADHVKLQDPDQVS